MKSDLEFLLNVIDREKDSVITFKNDIITSSTSTQSLYKAGQEVTKDKIAKLINFGYKSIEVDLPPELRDKLEMDFDIIPTVNDDIYDGLKNVLLSIGEKEKFNFDKISNLDEYITKFVNALTSPFSDYKYSLKQYMSDKTITDHSIRSAAFAVLIAHEYNRGRNASRNINLEEICKAALLSDIGILCKNYTIRRMITPKYTSEMYKNLRDEEKKTELLNDFDINFVPYYSYGLLDCDTSINVNNILKIMVLCSRESNTGGPLGANVKYGEQDKSFDAGLIISLSKKMDASLIANVNEKLSLESTLSYLEQLKDKKIFSSELIEYLFSLIPLYPIHTKVEIYGENGPEYAIVVNNHQEEIKTVIGFGEDNDNYIFRLYSRPIIKTIPEGKIINLMDQTSITITSVVGNSINYSDLIDEYLQSNNIIKFRA